MSDESEAIDENTGTINVYKLLPNPGDSLLIVNCGTHFEVRHQNVPAIPTLHLTHEEVELLRQGLITWN